MRIFAIIVFAALSSRISGQSCTRLFQYIQGDGGDVEGLVTLQPPLVAEHEVKVVLSIAAQLPSRYVGDLSFYKGSQASIDDLKSGSPLQYRIRFPIPNPLPKVSQIIHNGIPICSGEKEYSLSFITLTHKFRTNLNSYQPTSPPQYTTSNYKQLYNPQTPAPVRLSQQTPRIQNRQQFYTNLPQYSTQAPLISNRNIQTRFQCGSRRSSNLVAAGLIIDGVTASRTDFPWLVAHHHQKRGFMCGGSIVSFKIIVTAAHCIWEKYAAEPLTAYESTYYMGKYELKNLNEEGYISSDVYKFEVHPKWNPQEHRYDSDVGIAVLVKSIRFSNTIRPICIWTHSKGHYDLVGRRGWIAGWGLTERGSISSFPKYILLPAVDDADCLRSNPGFTQISSGTTFCVGDMSGRSPCQGDSGGAFVVKHENYFYLRGIVSAAILNEELECSRNDYSLFTDVSYFSDWINQHINQYDY